VVSLRDLILAPRHALIRELMESEVVTLRFDEDREAVTRVFARYDFIAVPVVDDRFGLLGIVTHDDVLDVVQAEATEDLQRQAGVGPIEGNYLDARFGRVWSSRAKWLTVLFFMQMFTIEVMAHYEGRLDPGGDKSRGGLAFLIVFIPLCLSVGGNAGSQASTLVTRALALEQIHVRDWLRVFRRELLMAVALAAALGVLAVVRTYVYTPPDVLEKLPPGGFWNLVWVVTLAVMGICLTGAIIGAMLPILIKWLGGDPALMSSPFIATLSDVVGIAIYFNVITIFF
jgi:magnesium transporter